MTDTKKKRLKTGFTTGAAAAAAAKGAVKIILEGKAPAKVEIAFLTGEKIFIPIDSCRIHNDKTASCIVIKDAGDDPDITNKAKIGVNVSISNKNCKTQSNTEASVIITGGAGVGIITKPGLEIPPGNPAINPGPIKMITASVNEVMEKNNNPGQVHVEIFVPEGEKLAKNTLNSRLGIMGGISILGTTGLERPMSHEAYIATILASFSVARAAGAEEIVLTTGRRSERYAQTFFPNFREEAFVLMGDFFKKALDGASRAGFKEIILGVFFGKALKMAQGFPHTHAAKSDLTMERLSAWALELTQNKIFSQKISRANTARHAFDFIMDEYPELISHVGKLMIKAAEKFAAQNVRIRGIIFDYQGTVIFDSLESSTI